MHREYKSEKNQINVISFFSFLFFCINFEIENAFLLFLHEFWNRRSIFCFFLHLCPMMQKMVEGCITINVSLTSSQSPLPTLFFVMKIWRENIWCFLDVETWRRFWNWTRTCSVGSQYSKRRLKKSGVFRRKNRCPTTFYKNDYFHQNLYFFFWK